VMFPVPEGDLPWHTDIQWHSANKLAWSFRILEPSVCVCVCVCVWVCVCECVCVWVKLNSSCFPLTDLRAQAHFGIFMYNMFTRGLFCFKYRLFWDSVIVP
jgi:hypothetical protein